MALLFPIEYYHFYFPENFIMNINIPATINKCSTNNRLSSFSIYMLVFVSNLPVLLSFFLDRFGANW